MSLLSDRLTPDHAAKVARFAALAVMFAFGAGAVGFGVLGLLASSQARSEEQRQVGLDAEVKRVQDVLNEASRRTAVGVDDQTRAVAAFQQAVSSLAKSQKCSLSEFLASTDVQPFLTRFEKQSASNGWSQIEAQFTLIGGSRPIFELLTVLAEQKVPIEFSSIQVSREDIGADGATVKAKVQLRILVQGGTGSA